MPGTFFEIEIHFCALGLSNEIYFLVAAEEKEAVARLKLKHKNVPFLCTGSILLGEKHHVSL